MDILDGIPTEGDELYEEPIDANSDSSTEEEVEEAGADPEENTEVKFDKTKTQERFQTLTEHNRELKEQLEEMKAWREEIEAERSQRSEEEEQSQIPEWFSNVMGENEEAWKGFQGMTDKMKQEAIASIKEESSQQDEEKTYWQGWVTEQLESIEGLKKEDHNQLMAIVEKYKPTDEEGNLDFNAGYEIMRELSKKGVNTVRKTITDTSNSSRTIEDGDFKGLVRVY